MTVSRDLSCTRDSIGTITVPFGSTSTAEDSALTVCMLVIMKTEGSHSASCLPRYSKSKDFTTGPGVVEPKDVRPRLPSCIISVCRPAYISTGEDSGWTPAVTLGFCCCLVSAKKSRSVEEIANSHRERTLCIPIHCRHRPVS